MAWMTREERQIFTSKPNEPDLETLTYWVTRLEPLIRAESDEEIIVVFCNRTGIEDDATYAGTSAVIGVQDGEVKIYGLLGRGERELLVVDTNITPYAKLIYRTDNGGTGNPIGLLERFKSPDSSSAPRTEGGKDEDGSQGPSSPGSMLGDPQKSPGAKSASSGGRSISTACAVKLKQGSSNSRDATVEQRSLPRTPLSASSETSPGRTLGSITPKDYSKKRQTPSAIAIRPLHGSAAANATVTSPETEAFNIPTPSMPSPTPMAVRPRLIIPESPPILPYQYPPSNPISALSERSEKSVRSLGSYRSDESEASTQTVRSNPRPPEESTPYPDSGAPLSGYPSNIFQSERTFYDGDAAFGNGEAFEGSTPFYDLSPTSPHMFGRPWDQTLPPAVAPGGWIPGTPIGRKPEPFPWPILTSDSWVNNRPDHTDRAGDKSASQDTRRLESRSPQSSASSNWTGWSGSSAATSKATTERQDTPVRPSSPKSRNSSRSRPNESIDAPVTQGDMATAMPQLESIAHRAQSASRLRAESQNRTPLTALPGALKPRSHSRNRTPLRVEDQYVVIDSFGTPLAGSNVPRPASRAKSRGRSRGPKAPASASIQEPSRVVRSSSTDSTRTEVLTAGSSRSRSTENRSRSRQRAPSSRRTAEEERVEAVVSPDRLMQGPDSPVSVKRVAEPSQFEKAEPQGGKGSVDNQEVKTVGIRIPIETARTASKTGQTRPASHFFIPTTPRAMAFDFDNDLVEPEMQDDKEEGDERGGRCAENDQVENPERAQGTVA